MRVYYISHVYTSHETLPMRTNIDIDDTLMAEAQRVSGQKQTAEEALRLMIRLRQQADVRSAFGKYRWTRGG